MPDTHTARREAAVCYRLSRTLGVLRPKSKRAARTAYRELLIRQLRRFGLEVPHAKPS